MQTDQWMTLTDYSSKYRVSISTLRRRIKAEQIAYKFADGKYLLQDSTAPEPEDHNATQEFRHDPVFETLQNAGSESQEPILSTATKLLNELKKAYTSILQEKEEQMVQLKEEVTDLKTLVRVLEQENARLRNQHLREHQ